MDMYVMQVKHDLEMSVLKEIKKLGCNALCPVREQQIRRGGKWHSIQSPLFPQYVFVECELNDKIYYDLKKIYGMQRLLGAGKPQKLPESEAAYIRVLNNNGAPIEASKVYVTSYGEKMILSGMLRHYTHDIISLDLRQRRAKVEVEIFGIKHTIILPVIGI